MKRVGVLWPTVLEVLSNSYNQELKQLFLIYDNLTFGDNENNLERLSKFLPLFPSELEEKLRKRIYEFEALIDQNILINLPLIKSSDQNKSKESKKIIIDDPFIKDKKKVKKLSHEDFITRMNALFINQQYSNIKAFPIVQNNAYFAKTTEIATTQTEVINLAMTNFPIISENVNWERIIEFKTDKDSQLKLLRLLNWSTDLSKSNYSSQEIIEKVKYLTFEYEEALKLHDLKFEASTLKTYFIGAIELIENLAKLNLTAIAKSGLEASKEHIELLEAERQLPGGEMAYFVKAKKELT